MILVSSAWYDGSQQNEPLDSTTITAAPGDTSNLRFGHGTDRDTLTVYVDDVLVLSVVDTLFRRPGAVGIHGDAAGGKVTLDSVTMTSPIQTSL